MQASYGETSGFAPVANNELTTVNGGSPLLVAIGMAGAGGAILIGAYTIVKAVNSK